MYTFTSKSDKNYLNELCNESSDSTIIQEKQIETKCLNNFNDEKEDSLLKKIVIKMKKKLKISEPKRFEK